MNIALHERLRQYQRNYYVSKKKMFLLYKNDLVDIKIWCYCG